MLAAPSQAQDDRPKIPSAAESIRSYGTLESWVRAWSVPLEPVKADPSGTTGVSVRLRLSGRVLGRAERFADDGTAMWQAARAAWLEADQVVPVDRDALREERLRELTPRVMIDVQFAGRLTPIAGMTERETTAPLSPGIEGIAVRVGERIEPVFPGTMLSTNTLPEDALRIAIGKHDLPPLPLERLRETHELTVYRFPARHLVQIKPFTAPEFLYRGGRVFGIAGINGPALRESARAIARHIGTHLWPGEEPFGLTGDYNMITDAYEPLIAAPIEQAAAALSLVRFAEAPSIPPADAQQALNLATEILAELAVVAPEESDPLADPRVAAMIVVAQRALLAHDSAAASLPAECAAFFDAAARAATEGALPQGPAPGRGLIALARVASGVDKAGVAVREVFRDTPAEALVNEMPWLGLAELRSSPMPAEVPAAQALRTLRELVWRFQVVEEGAGADAFDLAGGIVFTQGGVQLPTWHSFRAVAFLATMLGDPRLTEEAELLAEFSKLRLSLRFLLQLQVDQAAAHMARDAERATGGIRPAVWDQRCSLEASAMGLLTLAETLKSLDTRAKPNPGP